MNKVLDTATIPLGTLSCFDNKWKRTALHVTKPSCSSLTSTLNSNQTNTGYDESFILGVDPHLNSPPKKRSQAYAIESLDGHVKTDRFHNEYPKGVEMEEPYFPMQYDYVPNSFNSVKNRPPKPPVSSPTTTVVLPSRSLLTKDQFPTLPKIESNPHSEHAFFSDLAIGLTPRSRGNNLVLNTACSDHGMATIENIWQQMLKKKTWLSPRKMSIIMMTTLKDCIFFLLKSDFVDSKDQCWHWFG